MSNKPVFSGSESRSKKTKSENSTNSMITAFFRPLASQSSQPSTSTAFLDEESSAVHVSPDKTLHSVQKKNCPGVSHGEVALPNDISQQKTDAKRQPVLQDYPKSTIGQQQRSFSRHWYADHDWIEYSMERDCVFCFPCRFFANIQGHQRDSLTLKGFRDWKHPEKLIKHENSMWHKFSVANEMLFRKTEKDGNVETMLKSFHTKTVESNRMYIKSLLRTCLLLAKCNTSFRGHHESCESMHSGTFRETIEFLRCESEEFNIRFNNMPENSKYLCSDSQNALLEALSRAVLRRIAADVGPQGKYAIIIDGNQDLVAENLSLCIRYVDDHDTVFERFIGFEQLSSENLGAEGITKCVIEMLSSDRFSLDIKNCVATSGDGASVISGCDSGVQKRIRDMSENPCIFVHCWAHRLNLVLSSAGNEVPSAADFFSLLKATTNFINDSIKRKELFLHLQVLASSKGSTVLKLPGVCEHKWNFREKAVNVFMNRFKFVIQTLDNIYNSSKKESERTEAFGYRRRWLSLKHVCNLVVFHGIFTQLGPLSKQLQCQTMDLSEAMRLAENHLALLREKRSTEYFNKIWIEVLEICKNNEVQVATNNTELRSNRTTGLPARYEGFAVFSTVGKHCTPALAEEDGCGNEELTRCRITLFFPVMDKIIHEMARRFEDHSELIRAVCGCCPLSKHFLNADVIAPLAKAYFIDARKLNSQIEVARGYLSLSSSKEDDDEQGKYKTIQDVLRALTMKEAFHELRQLLTIALTVPISSVSCERSFSVLRNVRTYLRNTMTEKRLCNLAILSIEKDLSGSLDLDDAVNIFSKLPNFRSGLNAPLQGQGKRRRLEL